MVYAIRLAPVLMPYLVGFVLIAILAFVFCRVLQGWIFRRKPPSFADYKRYYADFPMEFWGR